MNYDDGETIRRKLVNFDCPILNIGDRKGGTGYIDFIKETELGQHAVMKGTDCIGRPFLAVKSAYVLMSGRTVPSFSIFFQRYIDEKQLWQCCGHDGSYLMHTEGGMRYEQFVFLQCLLDEKLVDLDAESIQKYRLDYPESKDNEKEEEDKNVSLPFQVRLREQPIKKNYTLNPRFVF
jgi:hypothetical protein